jgi:hypothetical protein
MANRPSFNAGIVGQDGKPQPGLNGTPVEIQLPLPPPAGFIIGGVTVGENEQAPDPSTKPMIFRRHHPYDPPVYSEQLHPAGRVVFVGVPECSECGRSLKTARRLYVSEMSENRRIEAGVKRYCGECYPVA